MVLRTFLPPLRWAEGLGCDGAGGGGPGLGDGAAMSLSTGVPHAPQNLWPGVIGAMQTAQVTPAAACWEVVFGALVAAVPFPADGSNESAALHCEHAVVPIGLKVLHES